MVPKSHTEIQMGPPRKARGGGLSQRGKNYEKDNPANQKPDLEKRTFKGSSLARECDFLHSAR